MTKQIRSILVLWLLLFGGFFAFRAASAANPQTPVADGYVLHNAAAQNFDGDGLFISYDGLGGFESSAETYLRFDLSSEPAISSAFLLLTTANDQLNAANANITLYAVSDDTWEEGSLNANNAPPLGSALQTVSLTDGLIFDNAALTAYLEAERSGDGIASLALKIDSVTGGSIWGALLLGDSEQTGGLAAPALGLNGTIPTAVGLSSVQLDASSGLLLLTLIGVALTLTAAMLRNSARLRRQASTLPQTTKLLSFITVIGLGIFAILNSQPTYAAECGTVPNLQIQTVGGNLLLSWSISPLIEAVDIYQSTSDPFFETGTLVASDVTESQYELGAPAVGSAAYYKIVPQCETDGDPKPSNTVGAQTYALTPNGTSFVGMPFLPQGESSADQLAQEIGGVTSIRQWNAQTQGFRYWLPPQFGDNFDINAGDALFVTLDGSAPTQFTAVGDVVRVDFPLVENGYAFFAVPLQADSDSADDLANQIGNVTEIFGWNGDLDPSNFALGKGSPVIVQGGAGIVSRWPGFQNGIMTWSQTYTGGEREVLLQWQTNDGIWPPDTYLVERSELGANEWEVIGEVDFSADASEMEEKLGALIEVLAVDLRDDLNGSLLSAQEIYDKLRTDPNLAALLGQQYYQVSIATGRGFLDSEAESADWEYRVAPAVRGGGGLALEAVCAPYSATPTYTLTGLRDSQVVNLAYADHGIRGGSHPDDPANRYEWGAFQQTRLMDGRTALIWDDPVQNFSAPSRANTCVQMPESAGAEFVLRKRPGKIPASPYKVVNTVTEGGGLLGVLPSAALASEDPNGEAYYFSDYIAANNPSMDADDIYDEQGWQYEVCAVNGLGETLDCAEHTSVVREFDSPASVISQTITLPEDHSKLTLTFAFEDNEEISFPLTAYIMRADESMTPLDQWTDIDTIQITNGSFNLYSVDDVPELTATKWYRVQIRDDAGNWSAPSPPIFGTRHNRSAVPFPQIYGLNDMEDGSLCETISLPYTSAPLDSRVKQVAVYRAFHVDGDYTLIKRIWAEGAPRTFTFEDDYQPPFGTIAYYRFEAIDGHGNISAPTYLCAALEGVEPIPPAEVDVSINGSEVTVNVAATAFQPVIELTCPSENGNETFTVAPSGTPWSTDLDSGETCQVSVQNRDPFGNATGDATTRIVQNNVDFLNTNRQLTDLGAVESVSIAPAGVKILLAPNGNGDGAAPYGALFRRPVGGTWTQVTNIQTILPVDGQWQIWDTSTRSDGVAYEYTALAFSTQSYELLGFWQPITLAAQGSDSTFQLNDLTMDPPTTVDYANCVTSTEDPSNVGLPSEILLHNGWRLNVEEYYFGNVNGCPAMTVDPDHLYGYALLTDGFGLEEAIEFVDIALDGNKHSNGRISADVNINATNRGVLPAIISQIEFFPREVNAIVEIALPESVRLIKSGYHTGVVGKFKNVAPLETDAWQFDPLTTGSMGVVDEALLWEMSPAALQFSFDEILLSGSPTVTSRLGDVPDNVYCFTPLQCFNFFDRGNNGRLLVQPYNGTGVHIDRSGLNGTFQHNGEIAYTTSFPGDLFVLGTGATLNIDGSNVNSGAITGAEVSFDRITNGSVTDFIRHDPAIVTATEQIQYRYGFLPKGSVPQRRTATFAFAEDSLTIGQGGRLLDSAEIDDDFMWGRFDIATHAGTLFIAPLQSSGNGILGAPAPAVSAWLQAVGDIDPGFNINFVEEANAINFSCFTGGNFAGSADLYMRVGGVSENVILNGEGSFRANSRGYQEKLNGYNGLFLDNGLLADGTTQQSNLFLPDPSDVTLPLNATGFGFDGCATDFELMNGVDSSTHDYWGLDLALTSVAYQPTAGTALSGLNAALGTDKEVIVFNGSAEISGLNYDTPNANELNNAITLQLATAWLPTGDIGNFTVLQHGNEVAFEKMYRVNGANFALSDVKINRRYSDITDTNSQPTTLGLGDNEANLGTLPLLAEMEFNGYDIYNTTYQQALNDCPFYLTGPCGLIMLDGEGYVEYFGRIEVDPDQPQIRNRTPFDPLDNPVGDYPLASTNRTTITVKHLVTEPSFHWMWPILNDKLDEFLPIGVVLNSNGGALAYAKPELTIFPVEGLELMEGDVGAVVQLNWNESEGYDDKVGLFFGATASQAAFRALVMNRPNEDGTPGTLPFDTWTLTQDPTNIELDIIDYANKFGYTHDGLNGTPDVVDLASALWSNEWRSDFDGSQLDFSHAYEALVDHVKSAQWEAQQKYGVSDFTITGTLSSISGLATEKGLGQATFWLPTSDHGVEIDFIGFGSKVSFDSVDDVTGESEKLFYADWIEIVYNRDKELIMQGEGIESSLTGDYDVTADAILLIGTKPGYRRVEGGIRLHEFEASEITFKDLGATFGVGEYNNELIAYLGIMGEGTWDQYRLGGILLFGKLYDSQVIRFAGFGDALDRLQAESPNGDPGVFLGLYLGVYGDIPVYSDSFIQANASGDVRFWYFRSNIDFDGDGENDAVYGGELNASIYATVIQVVSGRGNLGLAIESIFPGGTSRVPATAGSFNQIARDCPTDAAANPNNENCTAFTGVFWIAAGIGACEPETWTSWTSRWWDDSWCANAGAIVGLGYIDQPPTGEGTWKYDYELDFENPFD